MSKRGFTQMSQMSQADAASVISRAVKKAAKGKRPLSKLTVSEAVKTYVNRRIKAHSEKKQYTENFGPSSFVFSTSGSAPLMFDLAPAMSYGTGNGNRVGNKITVVKSSLTLNLFKSMAALATADVPTRLQVLIGRVIESPTTTPSTSDLDKLFWVDGGATDTFESGAVGAFYRPINKDYWDVRYRSPVINIANSNGTLGGIGANNDFNLVTDLEVPIWKFWPKTIKFDASTSGSTNCNWFLICLMQKVDFTTTTVNFNAPGITGCLNFQYEDA